MAARLLDQALRRPQRPGRHLFVPYALISSVLGPKLVIDVKPDLLQHWLLARARRPDGISILRDSFIGTGDWSPLLHEHSRSRLVREITELFDSDFEYRQTSSYKSLIEQVKGNGSVVHNYVRMSGPERVDAYFEHHLWLIDSIKTHGYVRREEVRKNPLFASAGKTYRRLERIECREEEVGVAVSADARLYRFRGGYHRTAVAQCLELERMPVMVKLVHADWLRQQIEETGFRADNALVQGVKTLEESIAKWGM